MNKIIFKKLTIQNFKSIGPKITFDFEKHSGLNFIFGTNLDIEGTQNGSGKSTLFVDAILFALYGKTLKNTNNAYLPNRVFSEATKLETFVELQFEVNGDEYTTRAGIKKVGSPVNFKLYKNSGDITKSTTPKTKEYLKTEILKCSFGLFVNSVILSSSNSYQFFTMSMHQKREYIENIFKITCFGDMLKLIRKDGNQLNKKILVEQQEQKDIRNNLTLYEKKLESFDDDTDKSINILETKIDKRKKEIDGFEIIDVENKLIMQQKALDKNNTTKKKIEEGVSKLKSLIKVNTTKINMSKKAIDKHKEVVDIVCDDCKKKIEDKFIHKDSIQLLTEENNDHKKDLDTLNTVLKKTNADIDLITSKINKLKKIEQENKQNTLRIEYLNKDIALFEQEIINLLEKKNPFNEMIIECKEKLDIVNGVLSKHYAEKTELDILEHVVSDDGAKKFMITDLIKVLNKLIRGYLNEMGAEFTVKFNEAFEAIFLTNTGECDYTSFSAGERQRINIATLFAFRDILNNTGIQSNISILDEVIDQGIDEFALSAILNILKRQCEEGVTIYLISHRTEIADKGLFDNIIEIQKKNSMSNIVSDSQGEAE